MSFALIALLLSAEPARGWKDVDTLVSQQKFDEALKVTQSRLEAAAQGPDELEYARALLRRASLRNGLQQSETAVTELREARLPRALVPRAMVQLAQVEALDAYLREYRWEINEREKVESRTELPLKQMSADQLVAAETRILAELWLQRDALGAETIKSAAEFITPGTWPAGLRDTLRDALAYRWVDLLEDTADWTPDALSQRYTLELPTLIRGVDAKTSLVDGAVHPLLRLCAVLDDLEQWHQKAGRPEAALAARVRRLRVLAANFTRDDERQVVRADLQRVIEATQTLPFSAWARAELADLLRGVGSLEAARDVAKIGATAFPTSIGGQRCKAMVEQLQAPDFNITVTQHDGPGQRSLQVRAKNLNALHFQAYRLTLDEVLKAAGSEAVLPQGDRLKALLKGHEPVRWSLELPATPDLKEHVTSVKPPLTQEGVWVIRASARQSFDDVDNRIVEATMVVSRVSLLHHRGEAFEEIIAVDSLTGAPVPQARVEIWRYNWNTPATLGQSVSTGADGVVRVSTFSQNEQFFAVARANGSFGIDVDGFDSGFKGTTTHVDEYLTYTDRAIYRPGQTLKFKVLGFRADDFGPKVLVTGRAVRVELHDANGQQVGVLKLTTNAFGTASGEFAIPPGRALGQWSLQAGDSSAWVRVEEYKRPTFEVAFLEPTRPLKLNAPATLTAEAKYYFGLPVTAGRVTWSVRRTPVTPWWWGWWYREPVRPETVAQGVTPVNAEGHAAITFTPVADPKLGAEVTYTYAVHAELTDEGGETRSADRQVQLGQVSVQATIEVRGQFVRANEAPTLTIHRTDLNGAPRAGRGQWRVSRLVQPSQPVMPADEPMRAPTQRKGEPAPYQTPGDLLRPRWENQFEPRVTLKNFENGAEVQKGEGATDAAGQLVVTLNALPAGAYRLTYTTVDDFGARCEATSEFLVVDRDLPAQLPLMLIARTDVAPVGTTLELLAGSAFAGQPVLFELFQDGVAKERRWLTQGKDAALISRPITPADRGGFTIHLTAVRDWQVLHQELVVIVPRDDKALNLRFSTFRDTLRPGGHETFRITATTPDGGVGAGGAEVLAFMYDRSLDSFGPLAVPLLSEHFASRTAAAVFGNPQTAARVMTVTRKRWYQLSTWSAPTDESMSFLGSEGIGGIAYGYGSGLGGIGVGGGGRAQLRMNTIQVIRGGPPMTPPSEAPVTGVGGLTGAVVDKLAARAEPTAAADPAPAPPPPPPVQMRSNFSETAFFAPHLLVDDKGETSVEFDVPESVTGWAVWAVGSTRDLRSGAVTQQTRTVKDLMVRPYLPRFMREGDEGDLKVVVNNASATEQKGTVVLELADAESEKSVLAEFGVTRAELPFVAKPGASATVTWSLKTPRRVGQVLVKVVARAGQQSDGERRVLPLLPSRLHLTQSKFMALTGAQSRSVSLADLAKNDDPTRQSERLVVTVDAQLFYSVLSAIPYLQRYPYECTEQTMNRFLSSAIVSRVFKDNPAIASMAKKLSARKTPLETFDGLDANRKLQLEESPWLQEAQGGEADMRTINMLSPAVVSAEQQSALTRLQKLQNGDGGFPWFPGGRSSTAITLYLLGGFSRAAEFGIDVPRDMVSRAWGFVAGDLREARTQCEQKKGCDWSLITFANYLASSYPDESWVAPLTQDERTAMLNLSFGQWKAHTPYLKGQLALTLKRANRAAEAKLVFDSVMDSAKTTADEGTFWQPEDRSWLWYNDSIETHAFALRVLQELNPKDARRAGLVQWLLLNKKLGHWKSTRATAEVIYSLVKFMKADQSLGVREESRISLGPIEKTLEFKPDEYTGHKNQVVVEGPLVTPAMSTLTVSKRTPGTQFASLTWHYATDQMPTEERGDFFSVKRTWFKRVLKNREMTLQPLAEGASIAVGDELEVQLSIRARQSAEYVHLRDPRGAGFEPVSQVSQYRYDLGLSWYEEIRDSGTNFFFEVLPAGEYTLKYRVRASMAGSFRTGPATLQSMYAPEFNAFSTGGVLRVTN